MSDRVVIDGDMTLTSTIDGEGGAYIRLGQNPVIQPLDVTENGTYEVPEGVEGFNPVTVNLPKAMTAEQIATGEDAWGDLTIEAEQIRSYAFRGSMENDLNTGESYFAQSLVTSLYAPNCKVVGEHAFFNQGGLKRITLPECTAIENNAFGGYSMYFPSMKTYLYAPKLERINRGLYSNVGPATWIVPPNVKSIDTSASAAVGYRIDREPVVIIILADKNVTINANAFPKWVGLTDIYVPWSEGEVANAPWGATNATIHYDTPLDDFAASWDGNLLQQEVIHPI